MTGAVAAAFQYAAAIAARFPTDASLLVSISRLYCSRGRAAAARESARRAVALNPAWGEAEAQLAAVSRGGGRRR